ncbi:hypothetical protein [Lactococcus lactis]|nr:hypothetical protein [Lactococcus lactis]
MKLNHLKKNRMKNGLINTWIERKKTPARQQIARVKYELAEF